MSDLDSTSIELSKIDEAMSNGGAAAVNLSAVPAASITNTSHTDNNKIEQQNNTINEEMSKDKDHTIAISNKSIDDDFGGAAAGYLSMLQQLSTLWKDCPDLYIQYHNISYTLHLPASSQHESDKTNFLAAGWNLGTKLFKTIATPLVKKWATPMIQFPVLHPTSGVIAPGSMTLVLAPAGKNIKKQNTHCTFNI